MSTPLLLYIASVLGAVALILMMPRSRKGALGQFAGHAGALLGAAALGGAWVAVAANTGLITNFSEEVLGLEGVAFLYFYIFSAIAIASAVMVITRRRPVYCALWFVMVVLSSAGLFLVLSADFMALAMVLIYGGAILVTYMFVIMLATQPGDPAPGSQATGSQPTANSTSQGQDYDRHGRDPLWACVAGFLLLAVLLTVFFDHASMSPNPATAMQPGPQVIDSTLNDRALNEDNAELYSSPTHQHNRVSNVERIGLDLFQSHPLAIELAGVILLVSLIGAVVIAKTHVEHEFHPGSTPPGNETALPHVDVGPVKPDSAEGAAG